MIASRLTEKSQATIPQEVRRALGLKPGDRVSFEVLPDNSVRLRKVQPLDVEFAHAVEDTLASEWNSAHDERAYAGL